MTLPNAQLPLCSALHLILSSVLAAVPGSFAPSYIRLCAYIQPDGHVISRSTESSCWYRSNETHKREIAMYPFVTSRMPDTNLPLLTTCPACGHDKPRKFIRAPPLLSSHSDNPNL
ncbi:unnamed protein product [Protopolystoma xenopodis]|uniref:Secreted protein n=1 Tax=Protopolystoma xenopodis TaxID=117903 RepID=A0A3S5CGJ0_9PLAT|nr:unnamed protein product [Protopolystoma xenopodis]